MDLLKLNNGLVKRGWKVQFCTDTLAKVTFVTAAELGGSPGYLLVLVHMHAETLDKAFSIKTIAIRSSWMGTDALGSLVKF